MNPSLRIQKFKAKLPAVKGSFIASSTAVVGDVSIGTNSSIWYGAVVRGIADIKILLIVLPLRWPISLLVALYTQR